MIKGFLPCSLVDWPGHLSCVVFLGGCNFACPWCHNIELALNPGYFPNITVDWAGVDWGWVDGVTITGGEPTADVVTLTETIIEIGSIPIKLDTNGSRPGVIAKCLPFLSAVHMDIKAPLEQQKYSTACGVAVNINHIKDSILLLKAWGSGEVVFRTTQHPGISDDDILRIKEYLGPDATHIVQEYRSTRPIEG